MDKKLTFIEVEKLDNVVEYSMVKGYPYRLLRFFMDNEWDIIYVFEEGELKAVASIGDIYRWAQNVLDEFVFNTNFSCVSEIDFKEAGKIFGRIKTIYEVPVVRKRKLIGVIRKKRKHTKEEWKQIHERLEWIEKEWGRKERIRFFVDEITRWKELHREIEMYIYINLSDINKYLTDKQKIEYNSKMEFVRSEAFDMTKYATEHDFNIEVMNLKLIQSKGHFYFEDYYSDSFNVRGKHRITPNANEKKYKIFFVGPCTMLGAYVRDTETIEYFIQEEINKKNLPYEVVNCAMAGPEYIEQSLFVEKMKKGDKVILLSMNRGAAEYVKNAFPKEYKSSLTEVYSQIDDPINSWLDDPAHCNSVVNKKIAERIWDDLCREGKWLSETADNVYDERKALQDYYIPYEIYKYFDEYMDEHFLYMNESCKVGAIVMNCNPFTLGHR